MALSIIPSSSSSLTLRRNYDVFISFRGIDTRHNFTDHLFGALQEKCIFAFRDDTNLKIGESISPELLLAIEGSQVFVVIFSKNYASSTWCLRELEKILDCVQVPGKRVLPIFYDIDPSEVRHQKGSFAEAFKKHEERFKHDLEMVQRWRRALTEVANLSGCDIRDKSQYAEIQKIVEEIIDILGYQISSLPNDLVGIRTPIEELEKLLHLCSIDDVRVVGISGMGGIGKTTLASALYGRISHQFDTCCFIDDLSRVYKHDGPLGAQKQILYQTQGGEHLQIRNLYDGANLIRRKLRRVKALIILDNVDQLEQLEKIAVNREWLGAGSRVIIISRDAHILKEYGLDADFEVPILNHSHAYQLFSRKAFKRDNIMTINEKLASEILYYANGLPLAIKVLGSFLYGRKISEWRSALARLRESPHKDIMDVLRLSFDGLEETEKDIFLDIACFFNRKRIHYVRNVLNCCGFHPDIGLTVLIDKSLIFEDKDEGVIEMHSLLQELGIYIVHGNSVKEPRKRSRLWLKEHFYSVMSENMEKNVEAIVIWEKSEIQVSMVESLSKMSRLRLLIVPSDVEFLASPVFVSSEFRYIEWREYPYMYLPSSFQPSQLVALILRHSSMKILWEEQKCLPNLRTLDLSYSKDLIKVSNIGGIPNLEELILKGCLKLVHVDPTIGFLRKLTLLNLKGCKNLISIPSNIFRLNSLKDLNLSGCSKVLISLQIMEMPCPMQWIMLPSFSCFSCLCQLNISFCSVSKIPDSIGCLHFLEGLDLSGNNFETLPSLKELSKLVFLNVQHCKQLKSLPELPSLDTNEQDSLIFDYDRTSSRKFGLYIFNCPELGESERFNMMALSWMKQIIQANQEFRDSFFQLDIVIPGSEIPWWFNNRSMGNLYLSVDAIIQNKDNYIGMVWYAVFSMAPGDSTTTIYGDSLHESDHYFLNNMIRMTMSINFESGAHNGLCSMLLKNIDLIAVKSNHMRLCYISMGEFIECCSGHLTGVSFCIGPYGDDRRSMESLHVENFGYRFLSKQDLQLMHCGNSLPQTRLLE